MRMPCKPLHVAQQMCKRQFEMRSVLLCAGSSGLAMPPALPQAAAEQPEKPKRLADYPPLGSTPPPSYQVDCTTLPLCDAASATAQGPPHLTCGWLCRIGTRATRHPAVMGC